jgi:valyl-tRNA synthetase
MCLRLLHPFTPFVTEELWGHLRKALLASPLAGLAKDWPEALIIAPWPEPRPEEGWEAEVLENFASVQEIERSIRNIRTEKKVHPSKRIPAIIVGGNKTSILKEHFVNSTGTVSGLDESQLQILESLPNKPEDDIVLVSGEVETYLHLYDLVNLDEERARLGRELESIEAQITRLKHLLASDFASKAPAAVVQKEREKLAAYRETATKLKAQIG